MLNLLVVVNCGPCAPFIGRCLTSLESQTYRNWRALVTVDPCGDETYGEAVRVARESGRIDVCRNSRRRFALENLVRAVRRTSPDPEDVIVILDGDDWLSASHALSTIVDTYNQHACWLTYGSWVSDGPKRHSGRWPAYPRGTEDFARRPGWRPTCARGRNGSGTSSTTTTCGILRAGIFAWPLTWRS